MTEHEQLSQLCERLGASRSQAATMASQLMKRADQIATDRRVSREVALKGLLDVVIKGRAGQVPTEFLPGPAHKSESSDNPAQGTT